jgi:hypothetical protein
MMQKNIPSWSISFEFLGKMSIDLGENEVKYATEK